MFVTEAMQRSLRFAKSVLGLVGATILVVGASCGENPVPENVSYMRDIKPLMEAHCIRCHGAGGSLNKDPDIPDSGMVLQGAPTNGYFTQLADLSPTQYGLMHYTGTTGSAIMGIYLPQMPPPPGERLTDRETTMLTRWENHPFP